MGHISSTVIGAALKLGNTSVEVSTYNGTEPQPTRVNLPINAPNSASFRITETFSPHHLAMASIAYVKNPELDLPDITHEFRYSVSLYNQFHLCSEWSLYHSLIYGAITQFDHASILHSIAEEFWFNKETHNLWGRFEFLQRTPNELLVSSASPNIGKWVAALTIGFTHEITKTDGIHLGIGTALTKTMLPETLIGAYGGNPWSGQVFLQLSGMKMWEKN